MEHLSKRSVLIVLPRRLHVADSCWLGQQIADNGGDDPRQFEHEMAPGEDPFGGNGPAAGFPFNILFPQMVQPRAGGGGGGNGFRVEFRSGPGGERRIAFGNPAERREGAPPDPFLA